MKVLLVLPDARMHKLRIGGHVRSMREAPLTLASLAALSPPDLDIEFKVVDESIDSVPLEDDSFDLVGISVMTGTANRAYEIADIYRRFEIPVVLGGVHVSILPEEASQHADSIVIGMAEHTWPRLLRDFSTGKMQKVYKDEASHGEWLENIPSPRMDLIRRSGYMVPNTVQATRGCRGGCDFCSVPVYWDRFQKRPVGDVIRDIKKLRGKRIGFDDVNLIDDVEYAKELFSALIPLKKQWGGLATVQVNRDPELLALMAKSGCRYLLIGFESVKQTSLNAISKGFNKNDGYDELMRQLHSVGISVQGCFVFGFDNDDTSVFDATVQRVLDLKVDIPRYSLYTPYPGTKLYKRLLKEGRILTFNWDNYDTMHVVIQPKLMSPQELYDGFKKAYKDTFKMKHILKRTLSLKMSFAVNFVGNLTYRIFVRRLYNEERYAEPYMSGNSSFAADIENTGKGVSLCRT